MIAAFWHCWPLRDLALAAIAWQFISRLLWPFGPCLACQDRPGRGWGSNNRRWNRCRKCRGTRERRR